MTHSRFHRTAAPLLVLGTALAGLATAGPSVFAQEVQEDPDRQVEDAAQDEAATDEPGSPWADQTKERRRVIRLRSGAFVRGTTRWSEQAGWEVREDERTWTPLPPESVEWARTERELLNEARTRLRGVSLEDHDGRTLHAQWLRENGLVSESLEELERVLRADPDHLAARRLVHEGPRVTGLPSVEGSRRRAEPGGEPRLRAELLTFGARTGAIGREFTVRELSFLEDTSSTREDLEKALGSREARSRTFAAFALRRLFPGEAARSLLVHSVLDRDDRTRLEAARALRDADQPALVLPLLRALESRNVIVRTQAAEALGNLGKLGTMNALEPLVMHYAALSAVQSGGLSSVPRSHIFVGKQFAYVQDFDVEVAQFQAVADPQVNVLVEGDVLQARVIGTRDPLLLNERRVVRQALRSLSGADPGDRPSQWSRWWEENRARFEIGAHAETLAPASSPPSTGSTSAD